jgi:hypothetical protein
VAYFLVTVSVQDGEFEYWRYIPVKAKNSEIAERRALKSDQEWTKNDHREVSCEGVREIPKQDFEVLAKYL